MTGSAAVFDKAFITRAGGSAVGGAHLNPAGEIGLKIYVRRGLASSMISLMGFVSIDEIKLLALLNDRIPKHI